MQTTTHIWFCHTHTHTQGISLLYHEISCPSLSLVSRNKTNISVGSWAVYVFVFRYSVSDELESIYEIH